MKRAGCVDRLFHWQFRNTQRNPLKQRLIDIEYVALNKYVTSVNQCVPEIYVIFTKQALLDPVK